MEIYGTTGVLYADNKNDLRLLISEGYDGFNETKVETGQLEPPYNDPFSLLHAVIRNTIKLEPYDPSSLENNMIVVEILDAARQSAQTRETVKLSH
jgi:predicted dehydrogenase